MTFVYAPNGALVSAVQTVGGVKTTLGQQDQTPGALNALPAGLRGLQFNQGATALVPFSYGSYLTGNFMQGGDPVAQAGFFGFGNVPLVTPTAHISTLGHVDYDLSDSMSAFAEVLYSHVDGGQIFSSFLTEAPAAVLASG